jgi:hypothetical protein
VALAFFASSALAGHALGHPDPLVNECTVSGGETCSLTVDKLQDEVDANETAIGDWTVGTERDTNATPLTTAIENEERDRQDADTALGDRITNEAAASQARDDALGKRIDKNSEAIEDAIALSAAIPDSWLSDSENFALALGGGFTDGSSAFGGIGMSDISAHGTN